MKVLLCSYFKFPEGDAGAIRHAKLAEMLKSLGHEVLIVGLGAFCDYKIQEYQAVAYTSLRESRSDFWGKVKSRLLYWRRLKEIICNWKTDIILMDDMRPFVTCMIKRYCKKKKIRLIHDSVEWYSAEQFPLGRLSYFYICKNIVNSILVDKSMDVIAISSYLYRFYKKKGINCVNIPIVLSEKDFCSKKRNDKIIHFIYAGQPGKKDNLNMIIDAFLRLDTRLKGKYCLHILGCTREQIAHSGIDLKVLESFGEDIDVQGRVKHSEVLELLECADFSLLMRDPNLRYSKAGFPTKVPESLAHSTPVIANITSDLQNYLHDEYNALIVPTYSVEDLSKTIEKAIELPLHFRREMCANALHVAKNELHYECFQEELNKIIGKVGHK